MERRSTPRTIESSDTEQWISPVTILDAQGRVVQVIPGLEFRRRARARAAAAQTEPAAS
jgi:hypothetical protein